MVINSSCALSFCREPWTVTCTCLEWESQFLYNLFFTILFKPFLYYCFFNFSNLRVRGSQSLLLSALSVVHLLGLDISGGQTCSLLAPLHSTPLPHHLSLSAFSSSSPDMHPRLTSRHQPTSPHVSRPDCRPY